MSAENNRKSIIMTKADSDTRHSMLLYGERYNKAKQNENADFRKIPVVITSGIWVSCIQLNHSLAMDSSTFTVTL